MQCRLLVEIEGYAHRAWPRLVGLRSSAPALLRSASRSPAGPARPSRRIETPAARLQEAAARSSRWRRHAASRRFNGNEAPLGGSQEIQFKVGLRAGCSSPGIRATVSGAWLSFRRFPSPSTVIQTQFCLLPGCLRRTPWQLPPPPPISLLSKWPFVTKL